MNCSRCGARVEAADRFCGECGAPVGAPSEPVRSGRRGPMIIGVAVLLLALGVAARLLVSAGSGADRPEDGAGVPELRTGAGSGVPVSTPGEGEAAGPGTAAVRPDGVSAAGPIEVVPPPGVDVSDPEAMDRFIEALRRSGRIPEDAVIMTQPRADGGAVTPAVTRDPASDGDSAVFHIPSEP